jgi:hypothetical protein
MQFAREKKRKKKKDCMVTQEKNFITQQVSSGIPQS